MDYFINTYFVLQVPNNVLLCPMSILFETKRNCWIYLLSRSKDIKKSILKEMTTHTNSYSNFFLSLSHPIFKSGL